MSQTIVSLFVRQVTTRTCGSQCLGQSINTSKWWVYFDDAICQILTVNNTLNDNCVIDGHEIYYLTHNLEHKTSKTQNWDGLLHVVFMGNL